MWAHREDQKIWIKQTFMNWGGTFHEWSMKLLRDGTRVILSLLHMWILKLVTWFLGTNAGFRGFLLFFHAFRIIYEL